MVEEKVFNLTTLTDFLNREYLKKTGGPFKVSDVQAYIRRGYLPRYLGDIDIVLVPGFPARIYKLVKK